MATKAVELNELALGKITVSLVGTTPLIVHAWSHKAKQQMLDKQMKKAAKGREAKNPEQDYRDSLYPVNADGRHQFPSIGFKAAVVRAGTDAGYKMTDLRRAFHIDSEFVCINGEPHSREDMVRVGMGTADIRYRAEFSKWSTDIDIVFNSNAISAEQLVNLFELAGFGVGIGEWRPEKNGQYGRFEVAKN